MHLAIPFCLRCKVEKDIFLIDNFSMYNIALIVLKLLCVVVPSMSVQRLLKCERILEPVEHNTHSIVDRKLNPLLSSPSFALAPFPLFEAHISPVGALGSAGI